MTDSHKEVEVAAVAAKEGLLIFWAFAALRGCICRLSRDSETREFASRHGVHEASKIRRLGGGRWFLSEHTLFEWC